MGQGAKRVMSRVLCQQERGADSLVAVLMGEDGKQDPFDGGSVGEDAHGAGSPADLSEAALNGVGGAMVPEAALCYNILT